MEFNSGFKGLIYNYYPLLYYFQGRDSSFGMATRYWLDGYEIESRWGRDFSVPVPTDPGAQTASYTMGTGSFPGVKRPGRGIDYPLHLSPRLKKE